MNNHIVWAKDLTEKGFAGFFDRQSSEVYAHLYPNYPPAALFLFYLLYPLPRILFQIAWWLNVYIPAFPSPLVFLFEKRFFLAGMLKLPAVAGDLLLTWLIFLFAKRIAPAEKKLPILAASAILFNPAFFYNSAYWGQIDVIPLVFTVAAFYLLLFKKVHCWLSDVLLTVAILVKPTALVFVPMYIILFLQKYGLARCIKTLLVAAVLFWLAFVAFLPKGASVVSPYVIYTEKIMSAQSLGFVTNGAFNFWTLITQFRGVKDTEIFVFGLSYRLTGQLITGVCFIFIMYGWFKLKDKIGATFGALFLSGFASFLFLTKMHERYLMLPLPFALLLSLKRRSFLKWFYALSFISFLNLYKSWPVPRVEVLFKALSHPYVFNTIALSNVVIFVYLLKNYYDMTVDQKPKKST